MTLYGFYHPIAANLHGSHQYKTPEGKVVEVTAVYPYPEDYPETGSYRADQVAVGEVTNWVKKLQKGSREPEYQTGRNRWP